MTFIKELQWRGLIHDVMPGTEERLAQDMAVGYVGYDPTAPSLHIGNLVTIMLLVHFQRAGHKPIALVGGATGMVGDPSGRSEERNMLSIDVIRDNQEKIKKQLEKFLDFDLIKNGAEVVNNYDWFQPISFLEFIREVGKHISINYMLAKDSVRLRMEKGISYTEFSYQLLQGYDYYWLYKNKNCQLQMGGSDQWGNITTGTELIRRKAEGSAFALTCPLITKSDGSKFGKSEGGNIWLSAEMTSPYKFYQYWLNASDEDAVQFIRKFCLFSETQTNDMIQEHQQAPHLRLLQKNLAKDITIRVHSENDYLSAIEASGVLFGQGTTDTLKKFSTQELIAIFEGVPQYSIPRHAFGSGINILDLLAVHTQVFSSKGEARRMISGGGLQINKNKTSNADSIIKPADLLNDQLLLIQKGKKNYYLILID
jgi:tyrosyl-tRNA synthetase